MTAKPSIYLDYNSTTPVKPAVIDFMAEILRETGNASSVHGFGRQARKRVETAREQVAALAGVHANQVIFGSGATEANNTVLKCFAGRRVLISAIEHSSVVQALPDATQIPVTAGGLIDRDAFEQMLSAGPAPALISLMLVNNEMGAIQNVAELARFAKSKYPGVLIHTDAVQAAGRIPIEFPALYCDYLTLSSHKMGGPQGVGALVVAPGAPPATLICGGGQEKRQRAGTENIAGIAAFGLAAELAVRDMPEFVKLAALRDDLEKQLRAITPDIIIFGEKTPRVANTCAIGVPGIDAQTTLMALDLDGIAISSGSACSSGVNRATHVLRAMRPQDHDDIAAFRISMGWGTQESDIAGFIKIWTKIMGRLKPTSRELQTA